MSAPFWSCWSSSVLSIFLASISVICDVTLLIATLIRSGSSLSSPFRTAFWLFGEEVSETFRQPTSRWETEEMASRSYPANTLVQKFLEESYNKERDTRLNWYFKKNKCDKDSGVDGSKTGSKQFEVFRRKIEHGPKGGEDFMKKAPSDMAPARYNKKITKYDDQWVNKGDSSGVLEAEMRAATPDTKTKLYDGFTKEGKGRYQYLHDRNKQSPEDKFAYPILSSWEYGWRLSDVIQKEDIKKPPFGRTRIVADTFYTRTGIPNSPKVNI